MKAAFISDIHYGKDSRTTEFSVPGESIRDENAGAVSLEKSLIDILRKEEVSYLFVGGDLTSVGSPAEFNYCGKKLLSIAEAVGIPTENVICSLGNHDIDWEISKLGEAYAEHHSDIAVNELTHEKYQLIAAHGAKHNLPAEILLPSGPSPAPFSGVVIRDEFIVFVLNTSWKCGPNQVFPHGKLAAEQLAWFQTKLEEFTSDSRTKIVLMHHHPHQYSYPVPSSDISLVEDGAEFLDAAGKYGINLVLHGHRHHPRAATIKQTGWVGAITFICAGSLAVNADGRQFGSIPSTFHIIDFEHSPDEFYLLNYEYSASDGWIPVRKYRSEVPLDAQMTLGMDFDSEERIAAIEGLLTSGSERIIKYGELPKSLRSMTINDLNELISKTLSDTYRIIGKFPDEVVFLKR